VYLSEKRWENTTLWNFKMAKWYISSGFYVVVHCFWLLAVFQPHHDDLSPKTFDFEDWCFSESLLYRNSWKRSFACQAVFISDLFSLFVYSRLNIFFCYLATVTITGDRAANLDLCLALMAFSSEGSFLCHTYCHKGPQYIQSHPKNRNPRPRMGFKPGTQGS
jgi:hypothetical protein